MTKKAKKNSENEVIEMEEEEFLIDDEENEENKIIADLKKDLLKRGKEKGSLDQGEIMDLTSKYDLSEDDYEGLIDFFQNSGIKIVGDEEETSLDDADVGEIDLEKQNQEMEADEELSDESAEKDEVEAIDDFSKLQSGEVKVNDSVKMYLKEIGKVNLLNAKEETELAKQIASGDEAMKKLHDFYDEYTKNGGSDNFDAWYKAIRFNYPTKEIFLTKCTAEDGQNAKNKLITANLRLVISIAKHYVGRGMHFLDLIQEGNMGLIKAVEKFDYTKGFKFSTYATWWIKQSINRGINDSKNSIHIPNHKAQDIARLKKNRAELAITLSREPTDEELIAAYPEWTSEKIKELDSYYKMPIVSLNEKVGDDENGELEDFEADIESEPDITKSLDLEDNMHQIANGLTALNSQERDIITRIYGISGKKKEDGESIAKDYHVSRERIRQIKERALRKMKEAIGNGK